MFVHVRKIYNMYVLYVNTKCICMFSLCVFTMCVYIQGDSDEFTVQIQAGGREEGGEGGLRVFRIEGYICARTWREEMKLVPCEAQLKIPQI